MKNVLVTILARARLCAVLGVAAYVCLGWASIGAAQTEPPELPKLRETYAEQLAKIEGGVQSAVTNLQAQYVASLGRLEQKLRLAGQLDPTLRVREERERFTRDLDILPDQLANDVADLLTVQQNYLKARDQLPVDEARQVMTLVQQYDRSLTRLQEQLTRDGNLDSALKFKAERTTLAQRPEVTSAQFILADAELTAKQNEPQPASAIPEPEDEPEPAAPALSQEKYNGSARNRIRHKFDDFADAIIEQDWEEAIGIVNPELVEKRGKDYVKDQLLQFLQMLNAIDSNQGLKLSAGDVEVDEEAGTATLIPKIWHHNNWHEQQAIPWVEHEGDWYVEFERRPGFMRRPGFKRPRSPLRRH